MWTPSGMMNPNPPFRPKFLTVPDLISESPGPPTDDGGADESEKSRRDATAHRIVEADDDDDADDDNDAADDDDDDGTAWRMRSAGAPVFAAAARKRFMTNARGGEGGGRSRGSKGGRDRCGIVFTN